MVSGFELAIFDAAVIEHFDRSGNFDTETIVIEIVKINDFFDASLDNGFGAIYAREVVHVDASGLELAHIATKIKDGIKLGMTNVGILGLETIAFATPREIVVIKTIRCTIVADG